jgi:peptidylprolyl isomerase
MKKIKNGDKVEIHYRATMVDDGSEIESTFKKEPFEMILGETKLIKGIDKTLIGMTEGETIKVTYQPEDAYGFYDPALIAVLDKNEFPDKSIPGVGWMMKIGHISVTVKAMDEKTVTLDGNHPLVGKPVNFEIKVVKVH